MPLTGWYAIVLLLFLVFASAGYGYFRYLLQKSREKTAKLARDLATANELLGREVAKLHASEASSQHELYAGLVIGLIEHGIVLIDHGGAVRFINAYAAKYLDLAAEPGMPYTDVLHLREDGREGDMDSVKQALGGQTQALPETATLVSQRGTVPVRGTIAAITAGPLSGSAILQFEDISEQMQRVREEQAFFSAAAHELRTPLTVIRMTISLLKDKFETMPKEKIFEHLWRADETAERLVRLVNEYLDISRIDQGRVEMKIEPFDMVSLTDEVIKDMAILAQERHLTVHHDPLAERRMVMADRTKATEILSNLLHNSLKYTVRGGVTISHKVTNTALVTFVTDTGMGISKETQLLLFQRFEQIGEARKQLSTKGSGLGLYISKKLAQLMRGDVALVKSEPTEGSTFSFRLPLG